MLSGKGIWTWRLSNVEDGDPWTMVSKAVHGGLSHITVKVSDGLKPMQSGDYLRRVVKAMHSQNIQVWAWAYVYGKSVSNAAAEGVLLASRATGIGADGVILDVEGEYEVAGSAEWVKSCCASVGAGFSGPLALSSFWKPSVHSQLPWHQFCALCDIIMPQVYCFKSDAGLQAQECWEEFAPYLKAYPKLQMFPTGAIAAEESDSNPLKVKHFCDEVDKAGWAGANFWCWDEAVTATWDAMAAWRK
jgi:hypothetical protein